METARHVATRLWLCLVLLSLSSTTPATANPQDYPQFAQQSIDSAIPVAFISVAEVKQRFDAATPQIVVDVRDRGSYEQSHISGALSIPLETFPSRVRELPTDTPIVLY
jgi:hypothetical protein